MNDYEAIYNEGCDSVPIDERNGMDMIRLAGIAAVVAAAKRDAFGQLTLATDALAEMTLRWNKAVAESEAFFADIERIKTARSNHPECDVHPEGDVVTCGWKGAVLDIDRALAGGNS